MQKLTLRQKMVLEYIQTTIDTDGYPPTLREIGNFMGIRSTNGCERSPARPRAQGLPHAQGHEVAHAAAHARGRALLRSNTLTAAVVDGADLDVEVEDDSAHFDDNMVEIPILGRVAAGALQEAIEQPSDHVRIDRMLIGGQRDVFGLRIKGDSMIEAGIHDGDYVFVRKQLEATRGQIVIALVGDEATCKYFFPERDHIRLEPANATMAPILVPRNDWRDTQLLGVVVGVYRKLVS